VVIDAVKQTRSNRRALADVQIEVEERPGRIDVRTRYPRSSDVRVSVDFTVRVPAWAQVELRSVSGEVRVTGVENLVRAESVSGNVAASATPRLERVKSVSGDVELAGIASGSLSASTVSGDLRARDLKVAALDISTVSGTVTLAAVSAEHVAVKSVSGEISYSGPLSRGGHYDLNSHSGDVRISPSSHTGFELTASTFSGSIHSDLPLTIGGAGVGAGSGSGTGVGNNVLTGRGRNRSMRATFGDGSAIVSVRTFSGDISITQP
jgi:DUF4097 and DUF4098 domain-containing protein YvlB